MKMKISVEFFPYTKKKSFAKTIIILEYSLKDYYESTDQPTPIE